MAEKGFNGLVVSLKASERNDLLERIKRQSSISSEPLYRKNEEEKPRKTEDEYVNLPFYMKIWYCILSIVLAKKPAKAFEDSVIAKAGREINLLFPGIYNYSTGLLLPKMFQLIIELKETVRFFYNALDVSVNKDRGAFYAFMASFEMPEIHSKLTEISDPLIAASDSQNMSAGRLKQNALDICSESFASITDIQREKMYKNVRSLICLKELAGFLFDRLTTAFQFDAAQQGNICPAAAVKGQLLSLCDVLSSMREVPSITLLSTLFVFTLRDEFENNSGKINSELEQLMIKTERSLTAIRNFNVSVPLMKIIRCTSRDMSYEPRELPGGEDWFAVLRNYWKEKIEDNYDEYIIEKKKNEIHEILNIFFKGEELVEVSGFESDDDTEDVPLKNSMMLSFIQTFNKKIFLSEMNQVLRPILIDGDFLKKENRIEFAESYNELIKVDDLINSLLKKMTSSGDYGKRYKQIRIDIISPTIRHRKMQVLMEDIATESDNIVEQYQQSLESMNAVIGGILKPNDEAKYDTLANLSQLMGKANKEFLELLAVTLEKLTLAVDVVSNIIDIEEE